MDVYSIQNEHNKETFRNGMKDGIPIALGYLAVSFSLGIAARNVGLSAGQGFLVSILCNASAGEYAGFTCIGALATYLEIALASLVANARYMLMSCAMSQRLDPKMPFFHRFIMAFHVTDELFGIAIARPGYLNPYYSYGAAIVASPAWGVGTMLGVIAGNMLPVRLVSAFSVALYGMFLAVIIPPARKNKIVAALIVISFVLSYLAATLPVFSDISEGTRTIILTVVIASAAAILFPVPVKEEAEDE